MVSSQTATRSEVLKVYKHRLIEAFESPHTHPIDLEWMVELFKYKHISSLTTHLKRHFREKKEYLKKAEGQSKKSWRYYISVDAFRKICHFCRHSERKVVAKYWLKKLGQRDKKPHHHHHHHDYHTGRRRDHTGRSGGEGGSLMLTGSHHGIHASQDEDTRMEGSSDESNTSRDASNTSRSGDESYEDSSSDSDDDDDDGQDSDTPLSYATTPIPTHSHSHTLAPTTSTTSELPLRPYSSQQHTPAPIHPFRRYHHEWNYLGLLPVNHYLLSFYYSNAQLYYNTRTRTTPHCTSFTMGDPACEGEGGPEGSGGGGGGGGGGEGARERPEGDDMDPSFDTNAFLSFEDDTEDEDYPHQQTPDSPAL